MGPLAALVQFYQDTFGAPLRDYGPFRCQVNSVFAHPLVTPNLLVLPQLTGSEVEADQNLFRSELDSNQHWINGIGEDLPTDWLLSRGYKPFLRAHLNFFSEPRSKREEASLRYESHAFIPASMQDECFNKCEKNSVNLPKNMQLLIERAFRESKAKLVFHMARDQSGALLGAVTTVSTSDTSMLINGWVDSPCRGGRLMSALFEQVSKGEFDQGRRLLFYWTLNSIIATKGARVVPLTVFSTNLR